MPYMKPGSQRMSGMVIINDCSNIVFANPDLNSMFGYDEDELLSVSMEVIIPGGTSVIQPQQHEPASHQLIAPVIATAEMTGKKKNGSQFLIAVTTNQFQAGVEFL